eukprot:SAG11_NODE_4276_length_1971_cov_1.231303_2_plen_109_part_00
MCQNALQAICKCLRCSTCAGEGACSGRGKSCVETVSEMLDCLQRCANAVLRSEAKALGALTVRQLRERAVVASCTAAAIEDALLSEEPREELVALLVVPTTSAGTVIF